MPIRYSMATTRVQVYIPGDSLQLLEGLRPPNQSLSRWVALLAHLGAQRYQQMQATDHGAGELTHAG